jgi:hypothetical protein
VLGPPVTLQVEGDPRARSTVRAAAEQLRHALLAHLATVDALDVPTPATLEEPA